VLEQWEMGIKKALNQVVLMGFVNCHINFLSFEVLR